MFERGKIIRQSLEKPHELDIHMKLDTDIEY